VIEVTPSARRRPDRAGDPLDGLVNLFDLGIVLSVAFLLAALSALHLAGTVTRHGLRAQPRNTIVLRPGQRASGLPAPRGRAVGQGVPVGRVYRLSDGRLVYVQNRR
jgi:hypothetical protein